MREINFLLVLSSGFLGAITVLVLQILRECCINKEMKKKLSYVFLQDVELIENVLSDKSNIDGLVNNIIQFNREAAWNHLKNESIKLFRVELIDKLSNLYSKLKIPTYGGIKAIQAAYNLNNYYDEIDRLLSEIRILLEENLNEKLKLCKIRKENSDYF